MRGCPNSKWLWFQLVWIFSWHTSPYPLPPTALDLVNFHILHFKRKMHVCVCFVPKMLLSSAVWWSWILSKWSWENSFVGDELKLDLCTIDPIFQVIWLEWIDTTVKLVIKIFSPLVRTFSLMSLVYNYVFYVYLYTLCKYQLRF